jgi:pseudouridine synthase
MLIRLQKILSGAGVASRRAAEKLMQEGRVSVNGHTVLDLGTKADPAQDEIRVDGSRIKSREAPRYLLLNKPRGYVTTRSDPQRRPTVLALLGGVREYVYPVGRLDYDSEGLLLLTNDGELAARLTHPRHEVERLYEVTVHGVPDERTLHRLASGIVIDGRRTAPAAVKLLPPHSRAREDRSVLQLGLHEGRNRQVRNMCQAVGHPVVSLTRVRIGPITDSRLRAGEYRELRPAEVAALKKAAGLTGAAPSPSKEAPDADSRERIVKRERTAKQDARVKEGARKDIRRDVGARKDVRKDVSARKDVRNDVRKKARPRVRREGAADARQEQPRRPDRPRRR